MANELAVVENHWLALAGQTRSLPVPFEQTIFLTNCHVAGTEDVDDILIKAKDVKKGSELALCRKAKDAADERAVAVRTKGGDLLGYLPRRHSAVMARLMDAGKALSAKVVGKELECHWLDITIAIEMKET